MAILRKFAAGLIALGGVCCTNFLANAAELSEFTDVGPSLLVAQAPTYPEAARAHNLTGWGIVQLEINRRTGQEKPVYMERSTGERVAITKSSDDETFDNITVKALRKWRLRHGPLVVELPLHFTLTPVSYSVDIAR